MHVLFVIIVIIRCIFVVNYCSTIGLHCKFFFELTGICLYLTYVCTYSGHFKLDISRLGQL